MSLQPQDEHPYPSSFTLELHSAPASTLPFTIFQKVFGEARLGKNIITSQHEAELNAL